VRHVAATEAGDDLAVAVAAVAVEGRVQRAVGVVAGEREVAARGRIARCDGLAVGLDRDPFCAREAVDTERRLRPPVWEKLKSSWPGSAAEPAGAHRAPMIASQTAVTNRLSPNTALAGKLVGPATVERRSTLRTRKTLVALMGTSLLRNPESRGLAWPLRVTRDDAGDAQVFQTGTRSVR
jgi:hypothetical protein